MPENYGGIMEAKRRSIVNNRINKIRRRQMNTPV
jgi:hypothetical protein